jgi:hypothetical protein
MVCQGKPWYSPFSQFNVSPIPRKSNYIIDIDIYDSATVAEIVDAVEVSQTGSEGSDFACKYTAALHTRSCC